MSYPRCFRSQKAYDAWAYYADRSQVSPNWPCIDCSEAYQARMIAARRCKHPEAIPGKSRPCPVPSADEAPEDSSGSPPLAAESSVPCGDSVLDDASLFIPTTLNCKPNAPEGARSYS